MKRLIPLALVCASLSYSASAYLTRINDAKAVYLTSSNFPVHADGQADDSAALQAAIDKVSDTTGEGILFIPEGRYRVSRTIYIWPGLRLIGYGANRPVITLGPNTPGYQHGVADMLFLAGARPGDMRSANAAAFPGTHGEATFHGPQVPPGTVPETHTMPDANSGTFYAAIENIDFEIGDNNPAAIAVRFHGAQHCYMKHIDFRIGSGLAGVTDTGNEAEDLHFYGGRYGILTRKPSPAWQFTLLDSTFEGQREAAIRENEAGLTLVHDTFRNVPTAVEIDRGYSDELWIEDSRFENISGPALVISNEKSRMTQIGAERLHCRNVPVFAQLRESGRKWNGAGPSYSVTNFSYGLTIPQTTIDSKFVVQPDASSSAPERNVIAALPPVSEWTNVRDLGAKGDGKSDDTQVFKQAIAEHRVLYIPMGFYVITDTLTLRPDTVIIGFHPDQTQLIIPDGTAAFRGVGTPKALLETPEGGSNIVAGIGLFTNGWNDRAVGALWHAGADSLMDDVRFLGGHGTMGVNGQHMNPYNNTHSGDPDAHRRWDSQYPSLWVMHGGGIFADIWTPDTFAQAGLYVSDTDLRGRVFELSAEHHVRTEMVFRNVSNWEFDALQTEGEAGESAHAFSLDIEHCHNLRIANYHGYRVVRSYQPFPYAVRISDSDDIRFRNIHIDNNSSIASCDPTGLHCRQLVRAGKVGYEDAIFDASHHTHLRDREFAYFDYQGSIPPTPHPLATAEKLADGFFNANGAAVDAQGNLFFADPYMERIYKLTPDNKDLTIVRDNPLHPVNLAFDDAGDLIVVSSGGETETVYAFRPGTPESEITVLPQQDAHDAHNKTVALAVDYWVNGDFKNTLDTNTLEYTTLDQMFRDKMSTRKPYQFVSPDKSLIIPADEVFVQGEPFFGSKFADTLMSTGLQRFRAGQTVYLTDEAEQKTYSGKIAADGTVSNLKLFAYQGGESVVTDRNGDVYIAAGQIYVYRPDGAVKGVIAVPERPIGLALGGADGTLLYVLSHHSVYAARAVR